MDDEKVSLDHLFESRRAFVDDLFESRRASEKMQEKIMKCKEFVGDALMEMEQEATLEYYNVDSMLKAYEDHIAALKNNKFILGIPAIDKIIRGVNAGEVLTIIARAGSYKTTLLQNLLKKYVNSSAWGSIFFSLEMPVASVTERFGSMVSKFSGSDIESMWKQDNNYRAGIEKQMKEELKNLFVVEKKISVEEIKVYLKHIQEKEQVKIGLIGIDYLGLLTEEGFSEYQTVSKISKDVKLLAKEIGLPIVMLCQTNRQGEDGTTPISLSMARGSGAIEESADFILGLYQTEETSDAIIVEPSKLICAILKNRKGPAGRSFSLDLEPETFTIGSDTMEYIKPKPIKKRKAY